MAASSRSRLIRVFLSSTFVDFQEERRLLVQQVFPNLRRRARSRGVEIVDVDLRWGVTEEQTQRGETLPLCLAEIDRCRPYFISLLGERYGWVPPAPYYRPELLERQPWLRERMGGASVTELEILHGVLRNPTMAGQALFYLRDPAYALAQAEPGWLAANPQERQRLEALKQQVRASGFPVVEGLADPQAIAERIEADLWAVIERRYPQQEPAAAAARETLRHADYRRARTGLYVGGEAAVAELEARINAGVPWLLISGAAGSGKSALIANWVEQHERRQPQDVVFCHHLGCTNDAHALAPLLGRLIEAASRLLLAQGQISEPLAVPNDRWQLSARVVETLQNLGVWCRRQGRRWIWVLDGLDRLESQDQQVLPWLPLQLPAGVHVVVSALACPARVLLEQRVASTISIAPLGRHEQEQLIERYLGRYTKQLATGLREQILQHPQAGSPLFLRVLLEELRQCASFETLQAQLAFYLSATTVDGLYARVLERLEADGHGDALREVLTMLWASRAGLSEAEVLEITGLGPLQWAPIDLALEEAFERRGNRLVFGHDYLRKAVESRYLPNKQVINITHTVLAYWFAAPDDWDKRTSEESPWQLLQAQLPEELREWLLNPETLARLVWYRGSIEVVGYWRFVRAEGDGELDELITAAVEQAIEARREEPEDLIWFVDQLADLVDTAGLYRELLLRLRTLSLETAAQHSSEASMLTSLAALAEAYQHRGDYEQAEVLYTRTLEARERLLGHEHPSTLTTVGNLAGLYQLKGDYEQAKIWHLRCLAAFEQLLGREHPKTLTVGGNLGSVYSHKGDYEQAEIIYKSVLEVSERLLGAEHSSTLSIIHGLGINYMLKGDYRQAEFLCMRVIEARRQLLGLEHPDTLISMNNLASLYWLKGDYAQAEALYKRGLQAMERLLGQEHPFTLTTVSNLASLCQDKGDYKQAEALYVRALKSSKKTLGSEHPDTVTVISNLAEIYAYKGDHKKAEILYNQALAASKRVLGTEHPDTVTIVNNLAVLYQDRGDYKRAQDLCTWVLEIRESILGKEHPSTLNTVANLAGLFQEKGNYDQAKKLYARALDSRERLLGLEHRDTLNTLGHLGTLYMENSEYEQAEFFYKRALQLRKHVLGLEHPDTLVTINNLGLLYIKNGNYRQAEEMLKWDLEVSERLLGNKHPDTLATMNNLGLLYMHKGDYKKSEEIHKQTLEIRELLLGPEHPDVNISRWNLAELFSKQARYDESIPLRRKQLEVTAARHGRAAPQTLQSIHWLADDLYQIDALEEAEQLYREALAGRVAALGDQDADTMASRYGLAQCLSAQGLYQEAIALRRIDLAWCRQHKGDTDPETLNAINQLALDLRHSGALEEAEALLREQAGPDALPGTF